MSVDQPPRHVTPSAARLAVDARQAPAQARTLAEELGLPLCDSDARCLGYDYLLGHPPAANGALALQDTRGEAATPLWIDFVGGRMGHRRRFGGGRGQPLARAMGFKGGETPRIVDATAGLGRDAFVLANLGAEVTLLERSPVLAALLADGLARAAAEPELAPVVQRMRLIHTAAADWLRACPAEARPTVVYLDPMYPHRQKSALVKKEMRALRALVGDDADAPQLLAAALDCASRRVVVKRPKGAAPLAGPVPAAAVASKNTRYDLYPRTNPR